MDGRDWGISRSRKQKLLTGDKRAIRLTAIFGMCLSVGVTIFGEHLKFEVITVDIHLNKFYQRIKVYIGFVLAIRIIIKTKMSYRNTLLKRYIYTQYFTVITLFMIWWWQQAGICNNYTKSYCNRMVSHKHWCLYQSSRLVMYFTLAVTQPSAVEMKIRHCVVEL